MGVAICRDGSGGCCGEPFEPGTSRDAARRRSEKAQLQIYNQVKNQSAQRGSYLPQRTPTIRGKRHIVGS